MRIRCLFVGVLLIGACLAGCGQKGPLKLPEPDNEARVQPR